MKVGAQRSSRYGALVTGAERGYPFSFLGGRFLVLQLFVV